MRHGWIWVLSLVLVLAGCIDTGGEEQATPAPSSSSASAAPSSTSPAATNSTENVTNEAPVGSIEADNVTGALPLNVTFTLNATDPEGEGLTWTFALGDASDNLTGTELPAIINHTYTAVGNFTATFEVNDGVNVDNITVAINVTAALAGEPQTHVITGSAAIPFPVADQFVCLNDDIDGNIYDLAPAAPGWSYTLSPGDGSFGMYWYSGGAYVSKATATGIVPEGTDEVEICSLTAIPGSEYTLTLTSP